MVSLVVEEMRKETWKPAGNTPSPTLSVSIVAPKTLGGWLTSKRGKSFGKALLNTTLGLGVTVGGGLIAEEIIES